MKRCLSTALILLITVQSSFAAITLDDIKAPKDIFYRMGTTDIPETRFDYDIEPVIKPSIQKDEKKEPQNLT